MSLLAAAEVDSLEHLRKGAAAEVEVLCAPQGWQSWASLAPCAPAGRCKWKVLVASLMLSCHEVILLFYSAPPEVGEHIVVLYMIFQEGALLRSITRFLYHFKTVYCGVVFFPNDLSIPHLHNEPCREHCALWEEGTNLCEALGGYYPGLRSVTLKTSFKIHSSKNIF